MTPYPRICATMVFAASALAAPALAALFDSPIAQANREATRRMWARAREEHAQQIMRFNEQITAARTQYWASYPDKPGAAEAAARFADLLREKDVYFSNVVLSNGMADYGGVGVQLDGQIRRSAGPEFEAWVNAVKLRIGTLLGNGTDPLGWVERLQHGPEMAPREYKRYTLFRDWWEFDQVQRIPAQFDKPETYGAYLYYRYKFAMLPKDDPRGDQPEENSRATYAKFVDLMGRQVVHDAARKVMSAPKTDLGSLVVTARRPVKVGPSGVVTQQVSLVEQIITGLKSPRNLATTRQTPEVEDPTVPAPSEVIGGYANPLTALQLLVVNDDDRRYLLWLLSGAGRSYAAITKTATEWDMADALYRRLVLAFGEKEALEVAHTVRTATKRMTDLNVMDPAAIGARREFPLRTFQDILARKNPRGYLRAALIARGGLDSPSAVDAAYRKLCGEHTEAALLDTARLRVVKPESGRPGLISSSELDEILEWLRHPPVEAPVGPQADYPDYLEWKGFTAGAKVSYTERVWQRGRMGDQLVAGGPTYRYAYQLQWINDESAKLWFTEINYGNYGQARPPHDSEVSYPAKYHLSLDGGTYESRASTERSLYPRSYDAVVWPSAAPIESGEEIVEIAGRKIATRWQSVAHTYKPDSMDKNVTLFVKVWTSDAVPRGLVRRIEERVFPPQHYRFPLGARFVKETYLDTFEGNRAGVAAPDPALPVAPAYAPSPLTSNQPRVGPVPVQPGPAPASAPASTLTSPPRTVATSSLSPAIATQMEVSQRLDRLTMRVGRAKYELARMERALAGQGAKPPAEIYAARDRADRLIGEAAAARIKGPKEAGPKLQELEDNIVVVENYLKLK